MAKRGTKPGDRRVDQIGSAYAGAAREILAILRELDPASYTDAAGSAALARIRWIVDGLNLRAAEWARHSIKSSYQERRATAEASLKGVGAKKPKAKRAAASEKIYARGIAKYVKLTTKDFLRANRTILATAGKYLAALAYARKKIDGYRQADLEAFSSVEARGLIDRTVVRALTTTTKYNEGLAHLTSRDVAGQILGRLTRMLDGQDYITINGRDYNLRSYAELVARTRMRDSQTEAVLNLCEDYGTDLVEIPPHADACEEICAPYQGQVYSISGNHPTYPQLPDGGPPFHPNCECTANPTTALGLRWRNR